MPKTKTPSTKTQSNRKKRHWACFVYPDSAPENWREILREKGLQCVISPLHEGELNADESEKKPHWHVVMCWQGPTTYNVVLGITKELNAPIPQGVESIRGYYRYLTHKDNPDKKQYDERDITTINGFNILEFIELSGHEKDEIKRKLHALIRQENIMEYAQLLDHLLDAEMLTEHSIASNNTLFFSHYIKSRRHMTELSNFRKLQDKIAQLENALEKMSSKGS